MTLNGKKQDLDALLQKAEKNNESIIVLRKEFRDTIQITNSLLKKVAISGIFKIVHTSVNK